MDKELAELVKISNAVGSDRSLVLGGGGNTSAKTADGRYMYIKASGMELKNMTASKGWRRLKVDSVLAILQDKSTAGMDVEQREAAVTTRLLCAADDKLRTDIRPSIESCFHAMLDKYVIHLHPVAVLAYACARNGRAEVEKLFRKEDFGPVWVPYANPGYALAKRIERLVADYKKQCGRAPAVMVLQNHGLVVTASGLNTAMRLVRKVVDTCQAKLKRPKAVRVEQADAESVTEAASAVREAVFQRTGKKMAVRFFIDDSIAGFMAREDAGRLCSPGAITPDELIYAGGPPIWLDNCRQNTIVGKLERRMERGEILPAGFLVRRLGLFVAGTKRGLPVLKDIISTSLVIRSFAKKFGGLRPLNKRQQDFIVKMAGKS